MNLFPVQNDASGRTALREAPAVRRPRSSASFRRLDKTSFEEVVAKARSDVYTVRRGDTLSEIVHDRLQRVGQRASGTELYARVREVAQANGLTNPDVIAVGQSIDLGVLDGRGGMAGAVQPQRSAPTPIAQVFSEPSHALHHIVPGQTRISSPFGPRQDPFSGDLREHRGIDIAARRGTPIFPVADGVVVHSGRQGGHGKTVIVRHNDGSETLYAHADSLLVSEGERVRTTDKLGLVGSTGRSTGPHLHFEYRRDGVPIDPLAVLGTDAGE